MRALAAADPDAVADAGVGASAATGAAADAPIPVQVAVHVGDGVGMPSRLHQLERFERDALRVNRPILINLRAAKATASANDDDEEGSIERWRAWRDWRCVRTETAAPDAPPYSPASSSPFSRASIPFESIDELVRFARAAVTVTDSETDSATSRSLPPHHSVPNLDFLAQRFGDELVSVHALPRLRYDRDGDHDNAADTTSSTISYASPACTTMPFRAYLDMWRTNAFPDPSLAYYVKDLHLALHHPDYMGRTDVDDGGEHDGVVDVGYRVPVFFADDWMHKYWRDAKELADDFRFVYAGPQGTWTPMHRDVYLSYSWSVNVTGRKLWILIADHAFDKLLHHNGTDVVSNLLDAWHSADHAYPRLHTLTTDDVWLCVQQEGEAIFVPSGWAHQVHNLDDCISINQNWNNAYNVRNMVRYVLEEERRTRSLLDEFESSTTSSILRAVRTTSPSPPPVRRACDESSVQALLLANIGMNRAELALFLAHTKRSKHALLAEASRSWWRRPSYLQHCLNELDAALSDLDAT